MHDRFRRWAIIGVLVVVAFGLGALLAPIEQRFGGDSASESLTQPAGTRTSDSGLAKNRQQESGDDNPLGSSGLKPSTGSSLAIANPFETVPTGPRESSKDQQLRREARDLLDSVERTPADSSRLTTADRHEAPGDTLESEVIGERDSTLSTASDADQVGNSENVAEEAGPTAEDLAEAEDVAEAEDLAEAENLTEAEDVAETEDQQPPAVYTISGTVLSHLGEPLAGVQLVASAVRLFHRDGTVMSVMSGTLPSRRTTSDALGNYAFQGIPDGEYRIMTVRTPQYPVAQIYVRAGVDYADLVITTQNILQLYGTVTNTVYEPISAATITAFAPDVLTTQSDDNGRFELFVPLHEGATIFPVRVKRKGYKVRELQISNKDWEAGHQIPLDIALEPLETSTDVSGALRSTDGSPVVGERVSLYCPTELRTYEAVSGGDGSFLLTGVIMSDNCRLSVNPKGPYEKYFKDGFSITSGLSVEIVLQKHSFGAVAGRMIDVYGKPVPYYTLVLRSLVSNKTVKVEGDAQGYFVVDGLPEGEVIIERNPMPHFSISGIRIEAGAQVNATLVLDVGSYQIQGRVTDSVGNPVAVPNISLRWNHMGNNVESSSSRATVADVYGAFSFSGVGPGKHTFIVDAPGFKALRLDYDPAIQGSEITLKLEALSSG